MLERPRLTWRQDVPVAEAFDDVYFSKHNGMEESTYVFLAGNNLPVRWQAPQDMFQIYELGFGTGLNFLLAWQLWQQSGQKGILRYTSAEKFPLTVDDLTRAHSHWPSLTPYARQLQTCWGQIDAPGFHSFMLPGVELTLFVGEAHTMLFNLDEPAHTWFLDGFAPAKNPAMWQQVLFDEMARLSRKGTTFATFTAAGEVRRGLAEAGFTVARVKGFAHKRHMLTGVFGS